MIRHSYLDEIGAVPLGQTVRWPYALALLAILIGGLGWLTVFGGKLYGPTGTHDNRATTASFQPARVAAPRGPAGSKESRSAKHGTA